MSDFQSLGLSNTLLRAVEAEGYTTPTPVQQQSIPPLLEGRDVLGVAQTGTGKTAAFALPVLQIMNRKKPQESQLKKCPERFLTIMTPMEQMMHLLGPRP